MDQNLNTKSTPPAPGVDIKKGENISRFGVLLVAFGGITAAAFAAATSPLAQRRSALAQQAGRLLDEAEVSYVYGGHQLGDSIACSECNSCLEAKRPLPTQRLRVCPACNSCSLDCSHFTALVYAQAAVPYPYLDTSLMLSLSSLALRRRYQLVDLASDLSRAAIGDLLVYDGHVVILERIAAPTIGQEEWRGDVVHATGGREITGPGAGIQRARFADLAHFRGPLLRILRHAALAEPSTPLVVPPPAHGVPLGRLRPVLRRTP